jgi:hypothetical protein
MCKKDGSLESIQANDFKETSIRCVNGKTKFQGFAFFSFLIQFI